MVHHVIMYHFDQGKLTFKNCKNIKVLGMHSNKLMYKHLIHQMQKKSLLTIEIAKCKNLNYQFSEAFCI